MLGATRTSLRVLLSSVRMANLKKKREAVLLEQLPLTKVGAVIRHCVIDLKLSVDEAHEVLRDASRIISAVQTLRDGV